MAEQEGDRGDTSSSSSSSATSLLDLPEAVVLHIFSLVSDVRTRNSLSLVSLRCRGLERSTRTSFCVRGNVRDLFMLPSSFSSVDSLDLSLVSPWGHPFPDHPLLSFPIRSAFPNVTSLCFYARGSTAVSSLAPCWGPRLRHVSLVRWHQRPPHLPPGADLLPLLSSCPNLSSLDLSRFYFWTEDLPAALLSSPSASLSLTSLDLLNPALPDGFSSDELLSLASACPNLTRLLAPCSFHPRAFHPLSDHSLLLLASSCPRLSHLHLADPASFHPFKNPSAADSHLPSHITPSGLAALFAALPSLEHFALDLCHPVPDSGPALELLANRCPGIKSLRLAHFAGICTAAGLHLDGVALCGGLRSLCVKDSPDLTDAGLARVARGCRLLSRLEIRGCPLVTSDGVARMAAMLRSTLVDVTVSRCARIDAAAAIRAVEPIRDRIERLHVDCVWSGREPCRDATVEDGSDLDEENGYCCGENSRNKKCRYADEDEGNGGGGGSMDGFWCRTWDRLRYLSLWIPAGVQLSPLPGAGLEECPELEEISIKIEGDCRARPTELVFGLVCLTLYPKLTKMQLDCGDATGYALTAPNGQMDLSLWERFYLTGIESLSLYELDYWPPQDKDVNQRSLSLPAAGLIQECATLRKLFIHGTTHEHFMRFFLRMPNLRDVQLREDYYPAPENDMSTEMRVDSCSRFEDALNSRPIPD